MKKSFTLFIVLFVTLLSVTNLTAQTVSACLHDDAGYKWDLTLTVTGATYSGKGKVTVTGAPSKWRAVVKGTSLIDTKLTATNPDADGCLSGFTDKFIYSGNATAGLFYGTEFRYDGSGTWKSYCSGSLYNTGVWSATDCYHSPFALSSKISKDGPAVHALASIMKVSPNPVNGQANISYSVGKSGTVNITIYNSMQQAVKVLVNDFRNAGSYSAVWDTKTANINSGIYRVVAVIDGNTTSTTVQVIQ